MLEQWEEFTAGPSKPARERLHVSLNHKGQFLLSKNVLDAIGNPQAVSFLYAKRTSKIGIRPIDKVSPKAFPLRARPRTLSQTIQASPFCRHHGIRVSGTVAFHQIEITGDGMLILDLAHISRVSRVPAVT